MSGLLNNCCPFLSHPSVHKVGESFRFGFSSMGSQIRKLHRVQALTKRAADDEHRFNQRTGLRGPESLFSLYSLVWLVLLYGLNSNPEPKSRCKTMLGHQSGIRMPCGLVNPRWAMAHIFTRMNGSIGGGGWEVGLANHMWGGGIG